MFKVMISFLVGAAVGAAAALLLAPSSGEELRHHMHEIADADRQRMRAEYQKGMDELHSRVDRMSSDVSSKIHKDKQQEEAIEPTPDAEQAS